MTATHQPSDQHMPMAVTIQTAHCRCGDSRFTHSRGTGTCARQDCPCTSYNPPDPLDATLQELTQAYVDLADADADRNRIYQELKAERAAHQRTRAERDQLRIDLAELDQLRIDLAAAQLDVEYLTAELDRLREAAA